MVDTAAYGEFPTAWCPGCGNHAILKCLKGALAGLGLAPHQVLLVSGIGQAAKTPHYLRANVFNGLHGRSLPAAQGAKLANPELTVVAVSGDGCHCGEGGNHFLAAIRRNVDMTVLIHDNHVYALTKGQASPTTALGTKTKAQPFGTPSEAFNPVAVAVALGAAFVARGFAGDGPHLTELIQAAIRHPGCSLVHILQPCVSFNTAQSFAWYAQRVRKLGTDHDPDNRQAALAVALEAGEQIPVGIISRTARRTFAEQLPTLDATPLARRQGDMESLRRVMLSYR